MPATLDDYLTREEVLALPDDGNRRELVYGELLVSPAPEPRHQRIALRLAARLLAYLGRNPVGEVLMSPADISWGRPDTIAQPDVFVVDRSDAGSRAWSRMRAFLLFAEIASPSTSRRDRFTKRRLYQDMRVPAYWIIDADRWRAETWTPDAVAPGLESIQLAWLPAGASEPFTIALAELFAD